MTWRFFHFDISMLKLCLNYSLSVTISVGETMFKSPFYDSVARRNFLQGVYQCTLMSKYENCSANCAVKWMIWEEVMRRAAAAAAVLSDWWSPAKLLSSGVITRPELWSGPSTLTCWVIPTPVGDFVLFVPIRSLWGHFVSLHVTFSIQAITVATLN